MMKQRQSLIHRPGGNPIWQPAAAALLACLAQLPSLAAAAEAQGKWYPLAKEGKTFEVPGGKLVRFGIGEKWVKQTVRGAGACTRKFFNQQDPAPGILKVCEIKLHEPPQATQPTQPSPASTAANSQVVGFGAKVTGGANGEVVEVSTAEQLQHALCDKLIGDRICMDKTPRIVKLKGIIDFNSPDLRKMGSQLGCKSVDEAACKAKGVPKENWQRILLRENDTHCDYVDERGKKHTDAKGNTVLKPLEHVTWNELGLKPIQIGSNKTLIGIGKGSGIKGRGLEVNGHSNVIIRNVSLTDINSNIVFAGDGITLGSADGVLIDHNRFARIGRQWITVGWAKATNVTISNNDFDGHVISGPSCDGEHYFGLIVSGADQTVTIAGNWMHNFRGRTPDMRPPKESGPGLVHLVNNLFEGSHGHAANVGLHTSALFEGNYFENVNTPIVESPAGYVYAPVKESPPASFSNCQSGLKRNCVANGGTHSGSPAADGTLSLGSTAKTDSAVINMFKNVKPEFIAKPYPAADVPAMVRAQAGPQ